MKKFLKTIFTIVFLALVAMFVLWTLWFFNPAGVGDSIQEFPAWVEARYTARLAESGVEVCPPGQTETFEVNGKFAGCFDTPQ